MSQRLVSGPCRSTCPAGVWYTRPQQDTVDFALCALPPAALKSPPRRQQQQTYARNWQQAEKAESHALPSQLLSLDHVADAAVSSNPIVLL